MARVPQAPAVGEVADRVRERRPGGVLRPIDEALLHTPVVADGWNRLLGTLRGGTALPSDLRELVVMRIAVLNRAPYEWSSHLADALGAGLSDDQLAALESADPAGSGPFSDVQSLVLRVTDSLTRDVEVPDALFEQAQATFSTELVVELMVTVAAYNMVSRVVAALQIEEAS